MTDKTLVRRTPWPASDSWPVCTPLQPSVVYASESPDALDDMYEGRAEGYAYAREAHPNADVLAAKLDGMEGVQGGIVLGSGMAAVTAALLGVLKAGDHLLGGNQLYGRSLRMMSTELPRMGIATSLADPTDVAAMEAAVRPETRMILIEVVSNPTLRVADLEGIAALCKRRGLVLAVDNTFTTPRAVRPLEHGADIVIHSVTKLLAGHSDATLGYVGARDADLNDAMLGVAQTLGLTASPFDCWLAERGLYSFELRYDRAEENARALADHLHGLPGMTRVIYPGRPDHPDHNRVQGLLGSRTGNMVTFEIEGSRDAANRLVRAARNIAFAPTLGDIGTTLSHPATSSHRGLTPEGRAALGLSEGSFRVSVGVEPADLLCTEFEAAVRAAARD
ncbi:aminotransferase class I/II-fold pyridoxal phosphate-dependent enzyme [Maribius pontilimi]|uniref:Aminotransferase class I/II-fold pyridoxal phosphate-dependent enzyme n=1 Tax=Palleronia pontilimi TaxID=1964209 RepID=A0A934IJ87_9RHOB|nr:aminotransferase class I/II-fold pyridoxal phosphate-dependent enzyme [Palleronia pontilimi]MBJ3762944.1 aminotransferase class I/II-fold pyridoxal phosphate-dependent enzyme [Palleronia pontilimi]